MPRSSRAQSTALTAALFAALLAAACGSSDTEPPPPGTTTTTGQGGTGGAGGTGSGGAGQGGAAAVCAPGQVILCYSGPPETLGVGACTFGQSTCNEAGSGFGPCEGEVVPQAEIPGDMIDDDCDGTTVSVGERLVARYYINEDPATGAAEIADTAADPLPLSILNPDPQNPGLVLSEDAEGHRGLTWAAAGSAAVAVGAITGTKVQLRLNGNQAFTIELVARIESIVNFARLVFIGRSEPNQNPTDALVLRFDGMGRLQAYVDDTSIGLWAYDYVNAGRSVLHLVVDTAQPIPEIRRRLYVNGALAPSFDATAPAQLSNVNLSMATTLSLGNRTAGTHSFGGTMYYAALYDAALTEEEISANAAQLLLDDDLPP